MAEYSDTQKSQALNAYLRTGGNFNHTHAVMRSELPDDQVPGVSTLKKWSRDYMWEATLVQVRNRLQAEAAKNALQELRRDLSFLETAKSRLMLEINGKYDEDGTCIRPPLEARTLESACTAIVRIMEEQRMLRGDESKYDDHEAESILAKLAKTAFGIKGGEEGNVIPLPGARDHKNDPTGDSDVE